ncbi:hypothetical protein OIDMADRAFT_21682 [Oidiodendron maius Zn]|uniref:Uncharacterized protein n=1 Tax=Oidiodendron maius (strain Zn) TaxID=913774 RepID=A0A0C3C1I1_OIDMZ|nr:hypothetical protein OIDMADRAFT_21682 [Oidiodendron maius Zn]
MSSSVTYLKHTIFRTLANVKMAIFTLDSASQIDLFKRLNNTPQVVQEAIQSMGSPTRYQWPPIQAQVPHVWRSIGASSLV